MENWSGKRVLILGAARQGLALARYLSEQGAFVTLNDKRTEDQLLEAKEKLADLSINWVFDGHPVSLLEQADLLCLSGAIPDTLPIVQEAKHRGLPLSNDTEIFLQNVHCPVIGITGSAGKTTTTTLVGRMVEAGKSENQTIWVGGNIGQPLLNDLKSMKPNDLVILELSSFQLELTTLSPYVGAILNITPNHLDRHGTMEAYTAAKLRLLDFQTADDIAVLNHDDPVTRAAADKVHGKLITFGFTRHPDFETQVFERGSDIILQKGNDETVIMPVDAIELRGRHNVGNVISACAIAAAADISPAAMLESVKGFTGVPHRLEWVRNVNSVNWYNDSICTAPERTIAAINSFDEPIVLLLGGRDKNLSWEKLAQLVHQRVDHVVLFGEAAPIVNQALTTDGTYQKPLTLQIAKHLQEAVRLAAQVAEPGSVVLLSPGGTSFDEFYDFEERGRYFRKWVGELR